MSNLDLYRSEVPLELVKMSPYYRKVQDLTKFPSLEDRSCFLLARDIDGKSLNHLREHLRKCNFKVPFGIFGKIHFDETKSKLNIIDRQGKQLIHDLSLYSTGDYRVTYNKQNIVDTHQNTIGTLLIFKIDYGDNYFEWENKFYIGVKYVVVML